MKHEDFADNHNERPISNEAAISRDAQRGERNSRFEFLRCGAILAGTLLTGIYGCASLTNGATKPKKRDSSVTRPVTDIADLYPAWEQRFNSANLHSLLDLYDERVTFINPQGTPLQGLDAIAADFESLFALNARISIYQKSTLVHDDICLSTNRWRLKLSPSGSDTQELSGGGIEVLCRQADGGWRFVIDDASRAAVSLSGVQAP